MNEELIQAFAQVETPYLSRRRRVEPISTRDVSVSTFIELRHANTLAVEVGTADEWEHASNLAKTYAPIISARISRGLGTGVRQTFHSCPS
jgi:hypothetical protein